MPRETRTKPICRKAFVVSLYLAAAALVGGCSYWDGIEFQGGVFDALGMAGSGQKKVADVKVEPRPALVLPPSPDQLPPPTTGSTTAAAPQAESWPVDPEDRRAQSKAELEKRHSAYCERAIQNARLRGDTGVIMGPKGNCQPGMFGNLGEVITGKQ